MVVGTIANRLWIASWHEGYPKQGYCKGIALYTEKGPNLACYIKPPIPTREKIPEEQFHNADSVAAKLAEFLDFNLPPDGKYILCGYHPRESGEWLDFLLFEANLQPASYYVHTQGSLCDVTSLSRALSALTSWAPLSHQPHDIHQHLGFTFSEPQTLILQARHACEDAMELKKRYLK